MQISGTFCCYGDFERRRSGGGGGGEGGGGGSNRNLPYFPSSQNSV